MTIGRTYLVLTVLVIGVACGRSGNGGDSSPPFQELPTNSSDTNARVTHAADVGHSQDSSDTTDDANAIASVTTNNTGTLSEESVNESPLATWDPSQVDAFSQEGIEPGTLDISDGCVFLTLDNGRKVLPVWPEPTSWHVSTQTIEFVSPAGGANAELQAGDRIGLGGATKTGTFSLFVTSPSSACEAQAVTTFIVSEVQVLTE